jgi:hypothetical protein
MSFLFFTDASLTVPLTSFRHYSTQGDRLLYFGNTDDTRKLVDSTNPEVSDISIQITDESIGSGLASSVIKLASSSGGLTSAVGGSPLVLSPVILGGVENAVPVHIRINTSSGVLGSDYVDLSFEIQDVIEVNI